MAEFIGDIVIQYLSPWFWPASIAIFCLIAREIFFARNTFKDFQQGQVGDKHRSRLQKLVIVNAANAEFPALDKAEATLQRIWLQSRMEPKGLVRALGIAFFYPVILLVGLWVLTGQATLGDSPSLLPEGMLGGLRLLAALVFVGLVYLFYWANQWTRKWHVFIRNTVYLLNGVGVGAVVVVVTGADAGFGFGAFVIAFVIAFVFAVTGAITGAFAIAFVGAIAFSVVGAFAFAFSVVFVFVLAVIFAIEYLQKQRFLHGGLGLVVLLLSMVMLGITMPVWLSVVVTVETDAFESDSLSFVWMLFFSIVPIINALSDWLSVSLTQYLLRCYRGAKKKKWLLLMADIFVAMLLVPVLFFAVFGCLRAMQACGWEIDAVAMIQGFLDAPFSRESFWIVLMALTNLIPTAIHFGIMILGYLQQRFSSIHHEAKAWLQQLDAGQQLSHQASAKLVVHLYAEPYFTLFVAGAVLLALGGVAVQLWLPLFNAGLQWLL